MRKKLGSFGTLLLACPLLLCLTQCASTQNLEATCGGLSCASSSFCAQAANLPLCAESSGAKCHAASGQCVWKIKTDANCPCIEHSVQLCNVNSTTPGVSICTANPGRTATSWAACTPCATCT